MTDDIKAFNTNKFNYICHIASMAFHAEGAGQIIRFSATSQVYGIGHKPTFDK